MVGRGSKRRAVSEAESGSAKSDREIASKKRLEGADVLLKEFCFPDGS